MLNKLFLTFLLLILFLLSCQTFLDLLLFIKKQNDGFGSWLLDKKQDLRFTHLYFLLLPFGLLTTAIIYKKKNKSEICTNVREIKTKIEFNILLMAKKVLK